MSFQGVNDDAYRNTFAHMKPDDRRRFFEHRLKQVMPGARLKSFQLIPEDMLDVSRECGPSWSSQWTALRQRAPACPW